jgi:DNA-binding MarR family transcriptional regulator
MRTWLAFWGVMRVVDTALDRDLRGQSDLSHNDYYILARLSKAPERRLRMSELADSVFGSRSRLTYQVTQLERAGLVRREGCLTDKRGAVAVLTQEGLQVLRALAPKHLASIRRIFFDQLTDEQVKILGDAFCAIIAGQGEEAALESAIERELFS